MANNVFANGLEIACKAGEGKSVACFPDVCFTPPPPPAGFIPIPYANTAYAKDTSNGSKTVFIGGKPVMKKDMSFFKTSTGNEPAAGPLGIVTHVKKGKAYFTSWSMNVKIEGKNVCRHTDGMTHNHGSFPGNTGVWAFTDTQDEQKACKKERKRMSTACEEKKQKTVINKKTKKRKEVDTKIAAKKQPKGSWRKHCKGLNIKPYEVTKEKLTDVRENTEQALKSIDVIDAAMDKVMAEIQEIALKKIGIKAAKMAAKKPLQAAMGPLGWAWGAYDVYDGIKTISELNDYIDNVKKAANELKQFGEKIKKLDSAIENFNESEATKIMADVQKNLATFNPCIRARKCQLVPMTQAQTPKKLDKGCCHGQTGHHIIPDVYLEKSECKKYTYSSAPVVCLEGTGKDDGSHGDIHVALEKYVEGKNTNEKIDYDDARDAAVNSHREAFPLSSCSKKCLAAQLDNYRDKVCGGKNNPELNFKRIVKGNDGDK